MNMSADPKHTPEPKNAAPLSIDGHPANPTLRYLKWGLGARCCSPASPGWSGSGPTT